KPDPILNALAVYRNRKAVNGIHSAVAWINAWEDSDELRGYKEFDLYWKGACECAAKFGFRLEEFRLDEDMTPDRLHQIFQTRGIGGILLTLHDPKWDIRWEECPWEHYAVVRVGLSKKGPRTHLVTAEQLTTTCNAAHKMRERG